MLLQELLEPSFTEQMKYPVRIRPGAPLDRIKSIERKLDFKFPPDLVDFYMLTDGLEGDDLIFNIMHIDELTKQEDQEGCECNWNGKPDEQARDQSK